MRRLGILLAIVFGSLTLNAATFGPEIAAARPEYSSAFSEQYASDVACGDQSCVALWIEEDWQRAGLYSSLINSDGSVQPASWSALRSGFMADASIIWTGDHYLAIWNDGNAKALVAAPLSRDGRISGAIQTLMTPVPVNSTRTALAWNGRRAFASFNTPDALWMAILDENGNVTRPVTLPKRNVNALAATPKYVVPAPTYAVTNWDVAAAGATFAVAWIESKQFNSTLNVARYDGDGSPIDRAPMTLVESSWLTWSGIGIAGNTTQFGLVYSTTDGLHRLRLDPRTGAVDTLSTLPFEHQLLGLYWSGDDFVVYGTGYGVTTNRFSSIGFNILNVSPGHSPSGSRIAPSSRGAAVVWTEPTDGNVPMLHVFGALIDGDATSIVKGRVPVSVSALPQTEPVVAPSPGGALLAWKQMRDMWTADILAQRVDAAGAPVGDPIRLSANIVLADAPAAVWAGNSYAVFWAENGVVMGTRISSGGVVLDDVPRIIEHGGHSPMMVSNGTTSLLIFSMGGAAVFERLDADGIAIDGQPISIGAAGSVATASNGSEFLVTWTQSGDIYAVRFTASGLRIDTAPIAIATGSHKSFHPVAGSDGRDFLIVYGDSKLVAKRLLAEGSLAGSTAQDDGVVIDAAAATPLSVAWGGHEYVVAWSVTDPDGATLVSTTADEAGSPVDTARALGRAEASLFGITAKVSAVQGNVVIAYSRGNAPDGGIPRVFTRQVLSGPSKGRGVRH